MDVFRSNSPTADAATGRSDPRLQPTPDYGTLGPGSDVTPTLGGPGPSPGRKRVPNLRLHFLAMMVGMVAALLASHGAGLGAAWEKFSASSPRRNSPKSAEVLSEKDLDRQKPQKQAEILLERAVRRSDATSNEIEAQIQSRVDGWRGKLTWNSELGNLTTAALNSNNRSLQNSAIEVQLAAYGLTKSESSVEALVRQANSSDHSKKIWALWSLGLLANRGIEPDRVVEVLITHLKASDRGSDAASEDARRWAVEGLALVGTTPTIAPLLDAMHNDPSATVRERAACSLAQSGMLSHEQRLIAVPQLINYSDDPALDVQTRGWAFQALGDITGQHLPNDSAAWRNWYQSNGANN